MARPQEEELPWQHRMRNNEDEGCLHKDLLITETCEVAMHGFWDLGRDTNMGDKTVLVP